MSSTASKKRAPAKSEPVPEFTLVHFTLFPKPPLELRLNIWGEVCLEPRDIDITINCMRNSPNLTDEIVTLMMSKLIDPHYFASTCPVPALIHASRESRAESLRYYTLDFASSFKLQGEVVFSHTPQIYIN